MAKQPGSSNTHGGHVERFQHDFAGRCAFGEPEGSKEVPRVRQDVPRA